MSRNRSPLREQRPVFVDASGGRQRRLRVAGAILVTPAVGYVGLLLSTVVGGPTIHSPFLPLPDPPANIASQHPKPTPTRATTTNSSDRPLTVDAASARRPGDAKLPTPAALPIPVALAIPVAMATSLPGAGLPSAGPTPAAPPKSTPVVATKAKGRPTALPTPTKKATGRPASLPLPPRRPIKPAR